MKKMIKKIIIGVILLVLAIAGYSVFFKKSASTPTAALQTTTTGVTDSSGNAGADATVGRDFLTTLLNINTIRLDDSLFADAGFAALQDFSRPLPEDPNPGRPNPFAPVGSDGGVVSPVATNAPSAITATGATFNGTLIAGATNVTRWFEYGLSIDTLSNKTVPIAQATAGQFSQAITGLLPNTTYFFVAKAQIGTVIATGSPVSFKTAQTAGAH